MKRLLGLILLFIVIAIGLSFAVLNPEVVQLNYYLGSISLPLSLVIVLALTLGALLGTFACLGLLLQKGGELRRLRKKLGLTEAELKNLRELPVRDQH